MTVTVYTVEMLARLAGAEAVMCTVVLWSRLVLSVSAASSLVEDGHCWVESLVVMNNGADNLVELARWWNDSLLPTGDVQHGVADGQGGGGQE